jgi:CheY-like chemotaxis protein
MQTSPEKSSRRLLLVEDDLDIRTSLTELLEMEGFNVVTANNGQEALNRLQTTPLPDLILLDLTMPVMDGRTFLEHKLKDPSWKSIPVLLFSAASGMNEVPGATATIKKPVDIDELMDTLQKLIQT